ncbi:MAG: glycosyltransferase [Nanoarchaeota archaeon]|nr:glycosyltransferase [Nanoarchaeota archaeon]
MSRVVCFSYERMFYPDDKLSGPGYRLWAIATSLTKKGHKVSIAELSHAKDYLKEGISFISWDSIRLKDIQKEFDVAIVPLSAYVWKYFYKIRRIPTLVDLTTPIAVESMAHSIGDSSDFFMHDGVIPTYLALSEGDYFVCSNEMQKHFYTGMLAMLGINTIKNNLIAVAPYAPEKKKPEAEKRKVLESAVGKDRKIMLWLGSLFSWYDYKTLIRAMKDISKAEPAACLVFAGGLNPHIRELTQNNYDEAVSEAKKLGLLGKNIFFIDWISPEDRLCAYEEAMFTVVTSYNTTESQLSYRTRVVDSLNSRVPVLCTDNDDLSKLISSKKMGAVIPVGDAESLIREALFLMKDRKTIERCSRNIEKEIQVGFNIEETIRPIHEFCSKPEKRTAEGCLDFREAIPAMKAKITDLEYIRDDKLATNETLARELAKYDQRFSQVLEDKVRSEEDLRAQIASLRDELSKQAEANLKMREFAGRFRGSIVFPMYRLTSTIGKTGFGRFFQKILK